MQARVGLLDGYPDPHPEAELAGNAISPPMRLYTPKLHLFSCLKIRIHRVKEVSESDQTPCLIRLLFVTAFPVHHPIIAKPTFSGTSSPL